MSAENKFEKQLRKEKEYQKEYYLSHKEEIRQRKKEWYKANKARIKHQQNEYRAANKDKIKKYYLAHKEQMKKTPKPQGTNSNADKVKEYMKEYQLKKNIKDVI